MILGQRVAVLVALAIWPIIGAQAQSAAHERSVLEGAWDYLPPLRGQALYVGNRYVMFNTRPDSAAATATLAESDQARLYRTLGLQSGTFTIADTIVTMHPMYSKNPTQGGRTWRWSYAIRGDTLTWRVLNAQGQATASGRSVRAH